MAATVVFSPVGNGFQWFGQTGLVLAGGKINTYLAGSTTRAATYTDNTGTVANANPIILDSTGRYAQEIWLDVTLIPYKFVVTDALGVTQFTLDNIPSTTTGAVNISYTAPGTGAVSTTVSAELQRQWITPEDYGAKGDGITDDTAPLTNWINALIAGPNTFGKMAAKTYGITAPLPQINVSAVWILGSGSDDFHNSGSGSAKTYIKWIGTSNAGTMLTIAPTVGVAQYLTGNRLIGVNFDCNAGTIANGVLLQSIRGGVFDFGVKDANTVGCTIGCVSSLSSDPSDFQYNSIRYYGIQTSGTGRGGISLVVGGQSSPPHDTSYNIFEFIDIAQSDALGIREDNVDSNRWLQVRVFQIAGGTAPNSIQWSASNVASNNCRSEKFHTLGLTQPAIAKGAGFTFPANNIVIYDLDKENSTADPVVEPGAVVYVRYSSSSLNNLPYRNRIINGDMRIDQRNAGAALTPGAGNTYTVDRWVANLAQASKLTFQQVTDTPSVSLFKYSTKISVAAQYSPAAAEVFSFIQPIEGQNIIDFGLGTGNITTMTVSLWIKVSVAGSYSIALYNAAANRYYIGVIAATTIWSKQNFTLFTDTTGTWAIDNTTGLSVALDLGSGSNLNAASGVWAGGGLRRTSGSVTFVNQTNGSTINVTGVQVELGSLTSYEQIPIGTELALCQRYFEQSYDYGVVAGTNTNVGEVIGQASNAIAGTTAGTLILPRDANFKVNKRAVPTVTIYSSIGTVNAIRVGGAADRTGTTANTPSTTKPIDFLSVDNTSATAIADRQQIQYHWTAASEL